MSHHYHPLVVKITISRMTEPALEILIINALTSSEALEEPAQTHCVVKAFAARIHNAGSKRKRHVKLDVSSLTR